MYIIDSQTAKGKYNQNSFIKFETESIKSWLCDYDDANLVSGNITVTANNNTDIAFKIVHHSLNVRRSVCWWSKAYLHCNAYVQFDTSGRLWQFKRDEYPANNADLLLISPNHLNIKQHLYEKQQMLLIIQTVLFKSQK